MKKYREDYPNYIYALTMGLGKTILMATCIFYEFLLANKYPRDKRYCHNALVFAPDKTVLQSLREIMTFDKTKVVPAEYARVLDANIKFHFLDDTGTILHTIDDSDFNIIISNTQKIIVKKKRKPETASDKLFGGAGSLLSAVYGDNGDDDDAWDDTKEGWNCRSLFGVALFRNPQSKIFVLQATMRCLRSITNDRLTATVFLSKDNYDILNDELHKNFNMDIKEMKNTSNENRHRYQVRVLPPPRKITLKRVWHEYTLHDKQYTDPVNFGLAEADLTSYQSIMYERDSLARDTTVKEVNVDYLQNNMKFSAFSLAGEVARYLNISCVLAARILREAEDGIELILETVNTYNAVLFDIIIPAVFHALFDVTAELKTADRELILLREPKDAGYYEFSANDDLVITNRYPGFTPAEIAKSFHADTYCFDSKPEKECFMQYITSGKVEEVYFTGMFTSNQGDLSVYYFDPESGRIRQYYPDFLARMTNGSYRLIEVKGDDKIDDAIVMAKKTAAEEISIASGIEYIMYPGSVIMKSHVLDEPQTITMLGLN